MAGIGAFGRSSPLSLPVVRNDLPVQRSLGEERLKDRNQIEIANLEVKGLFEVLDHLGVEKRVGALPGVHRAAANPAPGSVSVHFDPSVTAASAIIWLRRRTSILCTLVIFQSSTLQTQFTWYEIVRLWARKRNKYKPVDLWP